MISGPDAEELARGPRLPAHLYIHVPFCASKCAYCDFFSVADPAPDIVSPVFRGIESQLREWSSSGLEGVLDTVYVGGGTPTSTAEHTMRLVRDVRRRFVLHPAAEFTLEANPDSLDRALARSLAEAGVTRISVGVQSFDEGVLRLLGRPHGVRQALRACADVREAGLELSVDLMCGAPGQTRGSWAATLELALSTGPQHVSVYPLSLEPGTPLAAAVSSGLVCEPDADAAAEMLLAAEELLGEAGLSRYEVANYALPGHEARHNTAYWTGSPYLGVGPGAHGMLDVATASAAGLLGPGEETTGRVRYSNAADVEEWLVGRGGEVETLTAPEAAREDVMLGLRLVRGVSVGRVAGAGLGPVLERLETEDLVELAADADAAGGARWRTTTRGWLLGNEVFGRVWAGE